MKNDKKTNSEMLNNIQDDSLNNETLENLRKQLAEKDAIIENMKQSINKYVNQIVDADVEAQKNKDMLKANSQRIEDLEDQVSRLESDLKFTKEKSIEQFLHRLFGIINDIKIFKNKVDKSFLKYLGLLEKQLTKHLPTYQVEMKEVFIGDNYEEFDDEKKELFEVTYVEDENLSQGYITDIISNTFISTKDEHHNILSFGRIFVVRNDV